MRPRRLRRRPRPPDLDAIAGQVDRLAALAAAGATPARAFEHLAAVSSGADRVRAERVAADLRSGGTVAPAFADADPVWQRVGATVAVAVEVGAPLAPVLRCAARSARATVALQRAVAESVAGPTASARLVLLLPPVSLAMGWAFGFDVPGVLLGGPLGLVLLGAGTALLVVARGWSRRLIRAASAMSWTVGLRLELVAVALRAGVSAPRACALAEHATRATGLALPPGTEVDEVLAFAIDAGLPVVGLLDAEADRCRRAALAEARLRATVLAARLLLPLGVLVLPAFLLLGAVPIGLAVLRSTQLPF